MKSQIKHRALKSHEAPVMRKVMGFGVWVCLAGKQQPAVTLSAAPFVVSVCERERRSQGVCIFGFPDPDSEGSTKL